MRRGLRLVLSRRGRNRFALTSLAAFGLLGGIVQVYSALWAPAGGIEHPALFAGAMIAASVAYGVKRAWPHSVVERRFGKPEIVVRVIEGDLFDQQGHLVVGFTDTFDTDTTDGLVSPKSVQGQLLDRIYGGSAKQLDDALAEALKSIPTSGFERRTTKRAGKLKRYPLGTVAVIDQGGRRIFAVAYSSMQNDLVAKSSIDLLWQSLGALWNAVYVAGQRGTVAMPIVGSELARIDCVDRESLLRMILLSFVARSRETIICRELVVVVRPEDWQQMNTLELEAFLKTL